MCYDDETNSLHHFNLSFETRKNGDETYVLHVGTWRYSRMIVRYLSSSNIKKQFLQLKTIFSSSHCSGTSLWVLFTPPPKSEYDQTLGPGIIQIQMWRAGVINSMYFLQAGEKVGRDSVSSNLSVSSSNLQAPPPPPPAHGPPPAGIPGTTGSHPQPPADPRSARFHPYQREPNQPNIVNAAKDPRLRNRGNNGSGRSNGSGGPRGGNGSETAPKNIINVSRDPRNRNR